MTIRADIGFVVMDPTGFISIGYELTEGSWGIQRSGDSIGFYRYDGYAWIQKLGVAKDGTMTFYGGINVPGDIEAINGIFSGDVTANQLFLDPGVYDDIQGSVATIRLPPSSAPTWTTYGFGLGGPAFAVLDWQIGEYADIYIQTTHSMKLSTALKHHIHWTIPANDVGKKVKFQVDVIAAPPLSAFTAPTGSPFTSEFTFDGTEANKNNIDALADIPGVNTAVSTIYILRLERIAASSNDYTGNFYVLFDDSHIIKDRIGSINEFSQ